MAPIKESVAVDAATHKTERPPRRHVVTPEERKARAAAAKAFLARYGDDLDAHHSCLERMGG